MLVRTSAQAAPSADHVIDLLTPADQPAVEALLDRAFGQKRKRKTAQRLRDGRVHANGLGFALRHGGELVGSLTFWEVDCGGVPAVMLGPIAIDARHRSAGHGAAMIRHGLDMAGARGHRAVILVGDEPYYRRFGFQRAVVEKLVLPGPVDLDRFLGLELVPGALDAAEGLVRPTGRMVASIGKRRRAAAA